MTSRTVDMKDIGKKVTIFDVGVGLEEGEGLLKSHGLRPLTCNELISFLMRDNGFADAVRGSWIRVSDIGTTKSGRHAVHLDGETVKIDGTTRLNPDYIVNFHPGHYKLMAYILPSTNSLSEWGFEIYGNINPVNPSTIVLGVPNDIDRVRSELMEEVMEAKKEKSEMLRKN